MSNGEAYFECLPKDWNVGKIGTDFDIKQGKSISASKQTGKYLNAFLRTSNVFWGRLNLSHLDEMDFTEDECEALSLEYGDLLVCEGGDIGRTAIWRNEREGCYYQNHIHRLRVKNKRIDPLFIMYWMQAALTQLGIYEGFGNKTTIPNLSSSRLKEFIIPVPERSEQQKIAAVLFKIQQAIEIQESIIEKTRELKKSTLHHVFTHGLRGEKLKETEIGPIPESWSLMKIGNCCDIKSSTISFNELKQGRSSDSDVRCFALKVSDMNLPGNEKYVFSAIIKTMLSSKIVSEKAIPVDSIIFPKRGAAIATNKKRLTSEWSLLDPNLIAVIPRISITSEFLYYWFLTFDLTSIQDLGPTPQLNKKDVEPILVPCPSELEQFEIVKVLSVVDEKIDIHTAKKSALQDLFKTMLNKLMTGQIRVKDLDIDVSEVCA